MVSTDAPGPFMSTSILASILVRKLEPQKKSPGVEMTTLGDSWWRLKARCVSRYLLRLPCAFVLDGWRARRDGRPGRRRITRSGGTKSEGTWQRRAAAISTNVLRGASAAPASMRCTWRGERLVTSANCSCVSPRASRSSAMRRPIRASNLAASRFDTVRSKALPRSAEHVAARRVF